MPKSPAITCGIYLYDKNSEKLLICHAANASMKTWSIPKGLKEDSEDTFTAAARELMEETGIDILKLNVISKTELPPVNYKKQKKILESFLIITDTDLQNHELSCSTLTPKGYYEIDKWAWVEPEKILDRLHESQIENYSLIEKIISDK